MQRAWMIAIVVSGCGGARSAPSPAAPAPAAAAGEASVLAAPEPPPCPGPATREAVCDCLARSSVAEEVDGEVTCTIATDVTTPAGLAIARIDRAITLHDFYLLVEQPRGWTTAAELTHLESSGEGGVTSDLSWDKLEVRTVGKARLLWLERTESSVAEGEGETESESTEILSLCVLDGPGIARPACPLTVPRSWEYDRMGSDAGDGDGEATEEEGADEEGAEAEGTPGPSHDERTLDVQLGDDGTVTVKLVEGTANDAVKELLGTHRLF